MLACHWVSVVEEVLFVTFIKYNRVYDWKTYNGLMNGSITRKDAVFMYASWLPALRAPRPLITIRFLRQVIKFQLPRNRIQQIFKLVVV